MALTTAIEIRLTEASFSQAFESGRALWLGMAKTAYNYTKATVGVGEPKPQDVSPHLSLALQVSPKFLDLKAQKGTVAKYWFDNFADFIIDRTWKELSSNAATN